MGSRGGIVGLMLIIIGIVILALTYNNHEVVAQIGDLKITADTQKTISLPALLGGVSFIVGIVLVVLNRNNLN